MMFLGWYDPDKKKPAREKVADAVERYRERFGGDPTTCMTGTIDAAELDRDAAAFDLIIAERSFIPRFTFYVGIEEPAAEVVQP